MTENGCEPGGGEALREAISAFMPRIDRSRAQGEAQFAVLEGALQLLRVDDPRPAPRDGDQAHSLQEALGAVRAAVVATSYALVRSRGNHTAGRGGPAPRPGPLMTRPPNERVPAEVRPAPPDDPGCPRTATPS